MAIKKVNRGSIANSLKTKVTPTVEEDVVVEDRYTEEPETVETEEEVVETTTPVVEKKVTSKPIVKTEGVKKMNTPVEKKETPKATSGKRTLGGRTVAPKKEQVLGNVYSKERLTKDIQAVLDEKFEGVTLADCKFILESVEQAIYDAASQASLRMFGGILKASKRNQLIAKSPKTEYTSFTDAREVMTLTGSEIGQPEKYRGQVNGKTFTIEQAYDYETGKWNEAEGSFELDN